MGHRAEPSEKISPFPPIFRPGNGTAPAWSKTVTVTTALFSPRRDALATPWSGPVRFSYAARKRDFVAQGLPHRRLWEHPTELDGKIRHGRKIN